MVLREILSGPRNPLPDVLPLSSLSCNLAHLLAFVIEFLPLQAHQFAELRHFQVFVLLRNARSNVVAIKYIRCQVNTNAVAAVKSLCCNSKFGKTNMVLSSKVSEQNWCGRRDVKIKAYHSFPFLAQQDLSSFSSQQLAYNKDG